MQACHPTYAESINRRIMFQTNQSINSRPYLKNKIKASSMAPMVEFLPSKHKDLSSKTKGKLIVLNACIRKE
jgi:hypothetical protein